MRARVRLRALTRRFRYRGQRRRQTGHPRLETVLIIAAGVLVGVLVAALTVLFTR